MMGCDGYEDQFLALLMAIESSHADSKNLLSQKQRELKRSMRFINYDGNTSRDRVKGRE